jgi:D-alanyl-D-alanine carboxypeptidase/D-alanyl-D-alanine-endopeptidase (penicillin-binding protein 4)
MLTPLWGKTSVSYDKETSESPVEKLKKQLHEVIFHVDPTAQIGIKVLSVKDSQILFESNAYQRFVPAAAVKLLTAAAALKILGPNYCFETHLLTDGKIEEGVLKGNVYVEGSGDPSLSGDSLEDLIFQLKLRNIKEIEGDLVFDVSEFDELPLGPGWMWDEKLEYRNAPLSALVINHSHVKIWVKPAHVVTMAPFVSIEPEVPDLIIENHATMADMEVVKTNISVEKRNIIDKDVISIDGAMSLRSRPLEFKIPVKNPLLYATTEFSMSLKNNQIKHRGKIRFEKKPEQAQILATHLSDSVFHLVMHMLKNNDELYANCLFKKMGRVKYGKPGTWPNGSQTVRDFLVTTCNENIFDITILDGSGESRYNMMTPHFMTAFLKYMYRQFVFSPEFVASLPVAGIDASLKKRLKDYCLSAKLRVLPGTLKGISSLNGYVTTKDEEVLAFSIMINGFIKTNKEVKSEIEDKICRILAQFSRKE